MFVEPLLGLMLGRTSFHSHTTLWNQLSGHLLEVTHPVSCEEFPVWGWRVASEGGSCWKEAEEGWSGVLLRRPQLMGKELARDR